MQSKRPVGAYCERLAAVEEHGTPSSPACRRFALLSQDSQDHSIMDEMQEVEDERWRMRRKIVCFACNKVCQNVCYHNTNFQAKPWSKFFRWWT